ncbi:MAG: hypothetical protein PVI62_06520 [Desulfobacterales bacterium]|jgi:hypothetical protein
MITPGRAVIAHTRAIINGWEVVEDQAAVEDWEIKLNRNMSKREEQTPKPHKKKQSHIRLCFFSTGGYFLCENF